MDTSPFTNEERLVSVWIYEKGRNVQTFGEIRAKFALRFNEAVSA
jgi:hypothetical protein